MNYKIAYFVFSVPDTLAQSVAPVAAAVVVGIGVGIIALVGLAILSRIQSMRARRLEKGEE